MMSALRPAGRLADESPPPRTTPGASAKPFADEEKKTATDAQEEPGNMRDEIAERFPGRSIPFTDEEKKIVTDGQRELGNKWDEIAERLPGRSRKQVKSYWDNQARAIEGPFTHEEKKIVTDAQKELGNKWTKIAERLPGRSAKQVRDHWRNRTYTQRERERMTHNQARAIEGPFTDEEKKIVMDAQRELGNKWAEIAERLPGRSGRQVNSWWRNQIRSGKLKRKRRDVEEGSATPGPPFKEGRSFTDEESKIGSNAQKELGSKWNEIAERLPGRSGRQVDTHWHNQNKHSSLPYQRHHRNLPRPEETRRPQNTMAEAEGSHDALAEEETPGKSQRGPQSIGKLDKIDAFLRGRIGQSRQRIAQKEQQTADKDSQQIIAQLRQQIAPKERQIATADETTATTMNLQRQTIAQLRQQIAQKEQQMATADDLHARRIAQMTAQNERRMAEKDYLHARTIAEKDAQISQKERQTATAMNLQRQSIAQLCWQIAQNERQTATANSWHARTIAEKDAQISRLRDEVTRLRAEGGGGVLEI